MSGARGTSRRSRGAGVWTPVSGTRPHSFIHAPFVASGHGHSVRQSGAHGTSKRSRGARVWTPAFGARPHSFIRAPFVASGHGHSVRHRRVLTLRVLMIGARGTSKRSRGVDTGVRSATTFVYSFSIRCRRARSERPAQAYPDLTGPGSGNL